MKQHIYLNDLYDYYKLLLTEKQRIYFEDYYFNNLSLSEISENNNVSRNAIHKTLKEVEQKLNKYERDLKLNEKYIAINKVILDIDPKIKNKINKILEKWFWKLIYL